MIIIIPLKVSQRMIVNDGINDTMRLFIHKYMAQIIFPFIYLFYI